MESVLLSTGDVLEVVGDSLASKTLRNWQENRIVVPVEGGAGHGNHYKYSLMQVVGLAVGSALCTSNRGCSNDYVRQVVDAFAAMTERELEDKFRRRKTHLVMIHHGKPLLAGPQYDWPNVEAIYRDLLAGIAAIQKRYKDAPLGRPRGLAAHQS